MGNYLLNLSKSSSILCIPVFFSVTVLGCFKNFNYWHSYLREKKIEQYLLVYLYCWYTELPRKSVLCLGQLICMYARTSVPLGYPLSQSSYDMLKYLQAMYFFSVAWLLSKKVVCMIPWCCAMMLFSQYSVSKICGKAGKGM